MGRMISDAEVVAVVVVTPMAASTSCKARLLPWRPKWVDESGVCLPGSRGGCHGLSYWAMAGLANVVSLLLELERGEVGVHVGN